MDDKHNNYTKTIVVVAMMRVVVAAEGGRIVRVVVPRTAPHDAKGGALILGAVGIGILIQTIFPYITAHVQQIIG